MNVWIRIILCLTFIVSGGFAYAQAGDASPGMGQSAVLEEIIVTAERREASLQDTAISIASMSAAQIERTGASSLDELQAFIPNLSITFDGAYGRSNPQFNIRGVGSGVSSAGVVTERPVGLYIDGLYFSRVQGSLLSLIDAERVDVLRGPQGTLFGRNTTGGAISYTSKLPDQEFAGSLKGRFGEFDHREAQLMVNVPLSDIAAIRASAATVKKDGYMYRGPIDLGNIDDNVARVQLRIAPSDALTIDLSAAYSVMKSRGDARDITEFELAGQEPAYTFEALSILLQNQGEPPLVQDDPRLLLDDYSVPAYCVLDDTDPSTFGPECETNLRSELQVVSSRVVWDIRENVSLTSITGLLSGDQVSNNDWVWTGGYRRPFGFDFDNYSQEFQINWDVGNFKIVGGAIYFKEDAQESEVTTEVSHASGTFGGAFGMTEAEIIAGQQVTRRDEIYRSRVDSIGVFSQATWSATERLDLTAGLRYSRDEKRVDIRYLPTIDDPRDETGGGRETWSDTDWRLAAAFNLTPDVMLYASVTDAYKAGIADDSSLENRANVDNIILFIPPEFARGYEVGVRSEWLDRRLRLNVTAYRTDYTNRQSSELIEDPVSGIGVVTAINLGDVQYDGFEADFAALVTDSLTINGSIGVANYEREDNPQGALTNVPDLSWTAGFSHALDFASGATLNSSLNFGHVGETYSSSETISDDIPVNAAYGLLSGRITYASPNEKWSVALFGTNLLDEEYSTSSLRQAFHAGAAGRYVGVAYRGRPRSVGLEASVNF